MTDFTIAPRNSNYIIYGMTFSWRLSDPNINNVLLNYMDFNTNIEPNPNPDANPNKSVFIGVCILYILTEELVHSNWPDIAPLEQSLAKLHEDIVKFCQMAACKIGEGQYSFMLHHYSNTYKLLQILFTTIQVIIAICQKTINIDEQLKDIESFLKLSHQFILKYIIKHPDYAHILANTYRIEKNNVEILNITGLVTGAKSILGNSYQIELDL